MACQVRVKFQHLETLKSTTGQGEIAVAEQSHIFINREYVYSAVVYQEYLTRLRELIIFEPWLENYHFSQPS